MSYISIPRWFAIIILSARICAADNFLFFHTPKYISHMMVSLFNLLNDVILTHKNTFSLGVLISIVCRSFDRSSKSSSEEATV